METYEEVNHPQHYNNHPSGVECIDIVRHLNYNIGTAMTYLWRNVQKPGQDAVKDLNKSIWHIMDEIERLGGEVVERKAKTPTVHEAEPEGVPWTMGWRPDWSEAPEGATCYVLNWLGEGFWYLGTGLPYATVLTGDVPAWLLPREHQASMIWLPAKDKLVMPNPNIWKNCLYRNPALDEDIEIRMEDEEEKPYSPGDIVVLSKEEQALIPEGLTLAEYLTHKERYIKLYLFSTSDAAFIFFRSLGIKDEVLDFWRKEAAARKAKELA